MNFSPEPEHLPSEEQEKENHYNGLTMLTQATAVSVLILTGTLFIFLYRQVVLIRRQTGEMARYLTEVQSSGMQDFFEQVRDRFNGFRKEHPDFNPIYVRYFGTNEPPPPAKISGVRSAPAANVAPSPGTTGKTP